MMQHVATAKSEIAAIATAAESNSIAGSESKTQFGQVFEDQNAPISVVTKSKTSQQSPVNQNNSTPHNGSRGNPENHQSAVSSASKSDKAKAVGNDDVVNDVKDSGSKLSGEHNDASAKEQTASQPSAPQNDKKLDKGSSNIIAEEWVLLINNLKRLARNSESPSSSLEALEISVADLKLSGKVDEELLAQISDSTFADQTRLSLDGFKLPVLADSKHLNDHVVINKKQVEQTMSENADTAEVDDNELLLGTNVEAKLKLAKLVDEGLAEVLSSAELEGQSQEVITEETAKLLLQQPDVLHELTSQLPVSSQKSDTSEQSTVNSSIDSAIKKVPVLTNEQLENVTQLDLTQDENLNLLKALMVADKEDSSNTKVATKTVESGVIDPAGKKETNQRPEVSVNSVEPPLSSTESHEQEIQVATSKPSKTDKIDNVVTTNDIKTLLNLSEGKLDKVLENMAQRVFESNNNGAHLSPEKIAQQIVTPKTAEFINVTESSSKEFIAVLKSGIEEYKNQLSLGREPGIDLKALVAEALTKTTETASTAVIKTPVNAEQLANSVSQVLHLAHSLSRTIEERQDQIYSATLREVAQVQGEQSKQMQLGQVESKFEKAVNIAKPEGHQQLAEKVRWMVNTRNLVAEIRLDPAELGSVHVKVAMSGESATVNFVVQSQQARDAVDSATPRLKEMLAEKGIELGQSSVREESDGHQGKGDLEGQSGQGGQGDKETENNELTDQVLAQQKIVNGALGGIDYFV